MSSERTSGNTGRTLRLRDGRLLGYAEWGDPAGKPVLYLHGLHSSRLALYRDPAFFAAHGIRFITVDRPGIGLSSFQRGRTLLDWPDDLAQLAEALGVTRFAILAGLTHEKLITIG
jgi:pimeloyl-ACP methyl ester carboxylesterase